MSDQNKNRFTFDDDVIGMAKIIVVGVGGGGGNAVNNMVEQGLQNVDFLVINTDAQALQATQVTNRIQAGRSLTRGLGAGARPDVGTDGLQESAEEVATMLDGYDMCFITAGMGGGTGTGGAPVVAEIARSLDILVVAIVTKPFLCEGRKRMSMALEGIEVLKEHVDTLIVIPNERLLDISGDATLLEAFKKADSVLYDATRGIADLITCTGNINLDFADVRTTMKDGGSALMGTGVATDSTNRAEEAALEAISCPLMDGLSIRGARNVLVNVTAGSNLRISEATAATELVRKEAGGDVEVIFGTIIDSRNEGELRVTVIATGFTNEHQDIEGTAVTAAAPTPKPPLIRYKGEQNLKELDTPAFERRAAVERRVARAETSQKKDDTPKSQPRLRRTDKRDESRRVQPDDSDRPTFLRRMLD